MRQVVYLGGLGENPGSKHLRSRRTTALMLAEPMPPWKLVAGAMVIGGIAIITVVPLLRRQRQTTRR